MLRLLYAIETREYSSLEYKMFELIFRLTGVDISVAIGMASSRPLVENPSSLVTKRRITPAWAISRLKDKLETMYGIHKTCQKLDLDVLALRNSRLTVMMTCKATGLKRLGWLICIRWDWNWMRIWRRYETEQAPLRSGLTIPYDGSDNAPASEKTLVTSCFPINHLLT